MNDQSTLPSTAYKHSTAVFYACLTNIPHIAFPALRIIVNGELELYARAVNWNG